MNTRHYKPEYFTDTVELLKGTRNLVDLPSDIFFDVARVFETEDHGGEKLDKLLSRTYTVLALENNKPVGIASLDNEGNIGIFAVKEGATYKKAFSLLINTIERYAAKKELPYLFILPTDNDPPFSDFGYAPFDNGSGSEDAVNPYQLAKEIGAVNKIDIPPDSVKRIVLDKSRKITVEGMISAFPLFFFGIVCFFVALFIILAVTTYDSSNAYSFRVISIVVGTFFVAALFILVSYSLRAVYLKKKVLTMSVTNGVVVSLAEDKTRRLTAQYTVEHGNNVYTYVKLTYVFYDGSGQKREAVFNHRYHLFPPFFYPGQELTVAYSDSESYILCAYTVKEQTPTQPQKISHDIKPYGKIENAAEGKLAQYTPLGAVKAYYAYALSCLVFVLVCFLTVLIISAVVSRTSSLTFTHEFLFFLPFAGLALLTLGIPGIRFFIIPTRTKAVYRRLKMNPDANLTVGKIVPAARIYKSDNKFKFNCEYFDGNEIKTLSVPARFASRMLKYGSSEVKVIFDEKAAIVLVRKNRYPDI